MLFQCLLPENLLIDGYKKDFFGQSGMVSRSSTTRFLRTGNSRDCCRRMDDKFTGAREAIDQVSNVSLIVSVSVTLFVFARLILAIGEAGNFPAAIKATAEYFPKRQSLCYQYFQLRSSNWSTVSATQHSIHSQSMGLGNGVYSYRCLRFIWMGFWVFIYEKPEKTKKLIPLNWHISIR